MNQRPHKSLRIAAIGDVGVDWGFISNEPSRPRASVFQPWAHYPSTHLFAFPGGAWFSGHMIQGALAAAPFTHSYKATVSPCTASNATSIYMTGHLACFGPDTDTVEIEISLTRDENGNAVLEQVILNDEEELPAADISSISVVLRKESLNSGTLTLGLINAELAFESYTSRRPGSIEADTIYRFLRLTNARLSGPAGSECVECTSLSCRSRGMVITVHYANGDAEELHPVNGLSLLTEASRRGDASGASLASIRLPAERGGVIYLTEADIDVLYGQIKIVHDVVDEGKFNNPLEHAPIDTPYPLRITTVCSTGEITNAEGTTEYKLWMYQNPGTSLYMQRPGHIVHTLGAIRLVAGNCFWRGGDVYW